MNHTLVPTILNPALVRLPGTRRLAIVGYVGVTAFFVLSGFVLTWSWDDGRSRAGFYARRFARVWPLHALTFLAVVLFVEPVIGGGVGGTRTSPGRAVAGLALVHGWVPRPVWYFAGNGPAWSLSSEAFFYALLPFLVPMLRRGGRRAGYLVVAACVLELAVVPLLLRATTSGTYDLLSLSVFPLYRVGEFCVGVVIGWAVREGWRPAWSLPQAVLMVVVGYAAAAWFVGGLFFSSVRRDRALGNLYADLIVLLPVAALIAALAARDLGGRPTWLARPLPVLLGGASFAFYLVHVPVIQLLGELPRHDRAVGRGLPALAAVVIAALALALLLHRCVERPLERWLRQRVERREAARSEPLDRGLPVTAPPQPEERLT